MTDHIRVRVNDTGHEIDLPEDRFDEQIYARLDKPSLDSHGELAGPKYKTSVRQKATDNKAAKSVDQKEN